MYKGANMPSVPADQAKAQALSRFEDAGPGHINCGQAVLCFALLRMGEDPELITDARYLGGGIAGMGEVCGVLSGTALALGIRDLTLIRRGIKEPPSAADQLKDILRDFTKRFGACRCRDLTGHDLSSPEGMDVFKKSEIRSRCADYVSWACDRVDPLLESATATV
jgi:C_GCAxxG_C_C family probable redox protein